MNGRTPTRRLASLVALFLALAADAAHGEDIQWNNPAGGAWNVPANWSPEQLPTFGDRVLLTLAGTYTVTVSALDQIAIGELVIGGPGSAPTLDVGPAGNLTIDGPFAVHSGAHLILEAEASFNASGAAFVAGQVDADAASLSADGGLANKGSITIAQTSISGRIVNDGLLHTEGMCGLSTVENGPAATLEVRTGPGIVPGAAMDTLVNRGHASIGPSAQVFAGELISNEPNGVVEVEASTTVNGQTLRNAGIWRIAQGSQFLGLNFEQTPTGEFAPRYAAGGIQFSILCDTVRLDGTLAPVFDAAFTPPPGNLPLAFAKNTFGQFSIVSPAGTHGVAIDAAYLDQVYLRVLGPGIVISPPAGEDFGPVSTLISGCDLTTVTQVRLTRAGQSAIVADPMSRDADTKTVYATFDLAGRALGAWNVELEGPGGTQVAANAFTIEPTVVVRQPIRVEIFGQRVLRVGGSAEWALAIVNPNGTNERGAVEITIPPGLSWEFFASRPAKAGTRGAAGKFNEATTIIVPDVVAPPGLSMSDVRIRLQLPLGTPLGQGTLQARWYTP
jgi:hypothetical protein